MKNINRIVSALVLFCCLLGANYTYAEISLNPLFSDHMVVQRDSSIPIWGWAFPGEDVKISTSWGFETNITAIDSTWRAQIMTPAAGGPHWITVSGTNTISINDILSGEVWLCGGQSNMDHHLSTYTKDAREPQYQPLVEFIRNEITSARDTLLRTMVVPHRTSVNEEKLNFVAEWTSVNPKSTGLFSATGYFFAKKLREELDIPIGIIECARGATRIQPWISAEAYLADSELKEYYLSAKEIADKQKILMDAPDYVDNQYESALKKWRSNGEKGNKPRPEPHPDEDIRIPATYYNGMVASIIPYKIKGALWYQGESNTGFMAEVYQKYLTTLVQDWRKQWGQGDYPFYWVQLSAFKEPQEAPMEYSGWAIVNDQMRRSLVIPNTGMVVSYDIGEAKDIHPHNKMDVGERLAQLALKNEYGFEKLVEMGPLYESHKVKGDKIIVSFSNVGSGLIIGKKVLLEPTKNSDVPLASFEIAGPDGKWYWADAEINSKNEILVFSPEVDKPQKIRYAWSSNPSGANLYNEEGLPASVFTTEN